MTQDRKYQHGQADKKGQQNNEGKPGQSQGDKVGKTSAPLRKPNPPGRPGNVANSKTTAGTQKSKAGSTGGPTSKAGR